MREKAKLFEGSWQQVETENMDAVLAELGITWAFRKLANWMDIQLEIEAQEEGIKVLTKTKIRHKESFFSYSEISHTTGQTAEEKVEIEISFECDIMVQQSTVIRPEGNVITVRKYEMKGDQLHLSQICNNVHGVRIFKKLQ